MCTKRSRSVVGVIVLVLGLSLAVRTYGASGSIASIPVFTGEFLGQASPPEEPLSLWYRRPGGVWTEALAVGNGRLGAMVYGGVVQERLHLNEDTLWAGGPYDPANPEALAVLPEVRRLIFNGQYREAHQLVQNKMLARPMRQMQYQPAGDLLLTFPDVNAVKDYRRDLNLDTAVATVTYTAGGVRFTREVFSSPVDQVIVVRLTADKPGQVTFTAAMQTPQKAAVRTEAKDTLVMRGINGDAQGIHGALRFQARVQVKAQGGQTAVEPNTVKVTGADTATLLIAVATSYKSFKDVSGDPEALTQECLVKAGQKPFEALLNDHVAEHRRLFRRVSLHLGETKAARLPTDERSMAG